MWPIQGRNSDAPPVTEWRAYFGAVSTLKHWHHGTWREFTDADSLSAFKLGSISRLGPRDGKEVSLVARYDGSEFIRVADRVSLWAVQRARFRWFHFPSTNSAGP